LTRNDQQFTFIDSNLQCDWTFAPAISLYIAFQSGEELERLFRELSADGQVFVPLGTYPFSQNYVWFKDRYGVSWQLNLK